MSKNSEKLYIDPRQRRVNKSFEWIGTNLANHAWEVVERAFDHLGVSGEEKREARIKELLVEIRDKGFRPSKEVEPIELRQGEVQIKEQRERHADLALRHAVVVYDEYSEGRAPVTRPPEGQLDKRLELTFQRMQSSLLQAQRHLTALDILNNLEKKHYDFSLRASKGGKARSRPRSKKDQEALLSAMVKGMLYDPSSSINLDQADLGVLANEWAVKIYEFNRTFGMLRIESRNELKADIHTLLISLSNVGKDVRDREAHRRIMPFMMRRSGDDFQNDEADQMDNELAFESGFCEGIKRVIQYQIKNKFGEIAEEVCAEINAISRPEDLQDMLDRLPEATSWQEVVRGREIDS